MFFKIFSIIFCREESFLISFRNIQLQTQLTRSLKSFLRNIKLKTWLCECEKKRRKCVFNVYVSWKKIRKIIFLFCVVYSEKNCGNCHMIRSEQATNKMQKSMRQLEIFINISYLCDFCVCMCVCLLCCKQGC